ncbi:MAG: VCBS repeat-containing protein [bacterium]|nr:VCBS repeat-containing protein [bacterium]
MDYDGDGDLDLITGSYTGELYLFRRAENGDFNARELLTDESGKTIMLPEYSVVPELRDMDGDGDLDLVVGARTDPVLVIENRGSATAPRWSDQQEPLRTRSGEVIKGSNPHHADWDGDGRRDLVIGSEWGEVLWYRNTGAENAPVYEAGTVLVPKGSHGRQPEGSTPKGPGQRVKVHVGDWNDDGRVDLLVGDVTWQQTQGEPLTATEKAAQSKAQRRMNELHQLVQQLKRAEDKDAARLAQLEKELGAVRKEFWSYDRTELHTHGWVWVYLRQPGPATPSRGER